MVPPMSIPADVLAALGPEGLERVDRFFDDASGLTAYVVLHSTALGPAAGGVRTRTYASEVEAAVDAAELARSMTYKCALGGLDAGGGKAVVFADGGGRREQGFEALGRFIDSMRGDFRTAGDLGTTDADLAAMSRATRYVHTDTDQLAGAVAQGVLACADACADLKGRPGLSGLRAAVQGCGDIGAAVARSFAEAGADVCVADVDEARAEAVAEAIGGSVVSANDVLYVDVDLLAPCAVGGVITAGSSAGVRAWAVCGGANHICQDDAAHRALADRGVLFVPDLISSAGAVIEGIGRTVMGLDDRGPLLEGLRYTARAVLEDAARDGQPPIVHALRRAEKRLANAG